MSATYVVQPTDSVTVRYRYPWPLTSLGMSSAEELVLDGFRLDSTFLESVNAVPSSRLVPLLNGRALPLANTNKSGKLTFHTVRTGRGYSDGKCDIVTVADAQRRLGGTVGATITVEWVFNGNTFKIQFTRCIPADIPPLTMAGNDAVDNTVSFNYTDWSWLKGQK